jgi:hypothetical protein
MVSEDEEFSVNYHLINYRIRNDAFANLKSGPTSPVAQIEPIFLLIQAKYRQEAGQPLKPSKGEALTNSLLEGSVIQEKVRAFRKVLRKEPSGKLTPSWWCGFLRRNAECLQSLKGHWLHNARLEGLTFMTTLTQCSYELAYKQMVDAGIAEHLPLITSSTGLTRNVIESQDEGSCCGHKYTIKLTHPDWCLYGDEVENKHRAQDDEGHIGGQTCLSFGGERVNLTSSKTQGHFAAMGLTAGTGEPVMCIVIFAEAKLDTLTRLGYDHKAKIPHGKDKMLQENMGPGKTLPGAPTSCFFFRGKEVPALVAMRTKKGSMTSEVLALVPQWLDHYLGAYKRVEGRPIPFGLFDTHDTRLQVTFLLEKANKQENARPAHVENMHKAPQRHLKVAGRGFKTT